LSIDKFAKCIRDQMEEKGIRMHRHITLPSHSSQNLHH